MKKIIALILAVLAFAPTAFAQAPDNYSYVEKTVAVNGKNYKVRYVVVDGLKSPTDVYLGLAGGQLFKRDEAATIAKNEGAMAALNGPYHNESGGWSNYLFDCHYIVNGKPIRLFNQGSNFCVTNTGSWLFGRLRFTVMGKVKENLQPATLKDIFLSSVNQPPSANSTVFYTREYSAKTPTNYASTCVTIEKGVVTSVKNGPVEVPKDGIVLVYTGKNRERCDAKKWPKGYIKKGLHIDFYWKADPGNEVNLDQWKNSRAIFGGSPTVVRNGKAVWDLKADKHTNSAALSYKAQRAAFGTSEGKVYFVTFSDAINIQEEGPVLVQLGVKNAFNLDGGESTYLYFDGTTKENSSRPLPCMIIAKPRK